MRYLKGVPGKDLLYKPSQKLTVEGFSDADWADSHSDRRFTSGYCTLIDDSLVTWRSKKQTVVARSSAKVEYHAIAHIASEKMWMRSLHEMRVMVPIPMKMRCDNQSAIFIASNIVFHEHTKHIEMDCHFILDLVIKKYILTPFVLSI